ncbi:hypothetical protein PIROE2DRAFT_65344 [Piromyces sp. E2]|nr:hypothetical protein PIROE2DRAFT_65344 [Piromyces sp. E2]|eukprot:OUM56826.1 hypothetical protein PIROE2DRAFT_65344 [Piromyces sp. E2]
MTNNNLQGSIPDSIVELQNLVYLDLSNNKLEGSLPRNFTIPNLKYLLLSNNKFTGNLSNIQTAYQRMVHLDFSMNNFEGNFYPIIMNNYQLTNIIFSYNNLSGEIPREIENFKNLKELSLANNHLTGEIPSTIGDLTFLENLRLNDNDLSGVIPYEFNKLKNLKILYLNNNGKLGGYVPPLDHLAPGHCDYSSTEMCDLNNSNCFAAPSICSKNDILKINSENGCPDPLDDFSTSTTASKVVIGIIFLLIGVIIGIVTPIILRKTGFANKMKYTSLKNKVDVEDENKSSGSNEVDQNQPHNEDNVTVTSRHSSNTNHSSNASNTNNTNTNNTNYTNNSNISSNNLPVILNNQNTTEENVEAILRSYNISLNNQRNNNSNDIRSNLNNRPIIIVTNNIRGLKPEIVEPNDIKEKEKLYEDEKRVTTSEPVVPYVALPADSVPIMEVRQYNENDERPYYNRHRPNTNNNNNNTVRNNAEPLERQYGQNLMHN